MASSAQKRSTEGTTLQKRSSEAQKMLTRYPDRRPVICFKVSGAGSGLEEEALLDLPERKKFLVPNDMSIDAFKDTVRKYINETVNVSLSLDSIKLLVNDTKLQAKTIQDAYDQHKADDSFLYVSFSVCIFDDFVTGGRTMPARPPAALPDCQPPAGAVFDIAGRAAKNSASRLMAKNPNQIPVICNKDSGLYAPELQKCKFLVPFSMLCWEFRTVVRKSMQCQGEVLGDVSLCANNVALDAASSMSDIYKQCKASDGFLYLDYGLVQPVAVSEKVVESREAQASGYEGKKHVAEMNVEEVPAQVDTPVEVQGEASAAQSACQPKDLETDRAMAQLQVLVTEKDQLIESAAAQLQELRADLDRTKAAHAEELECARAEKELEIASTLSAEILRLREALVETRKQKEALLQQSSQEREAATTKAQELQSKVVLKLQDVQEENMTLKLVSEQKEALVTRKDQEVATLTAQLQELSAECDRSVVGADGLKAAHAMELERAKAAAERAGAARIEELRAELAQVKAATQAESKALAEKVREDASSATAELVKAQAANALLESQLEAMHHSQEAVVKAQKSKDSLLKYSASVLYMEDELTLGIEAEEDVMARGECTAELAELVSSCGAQQAFRIGRMRLPANFSEAAPACAKLVVKNQGSSAWPRTTVIVNMEGENLGLQVKELGALGPGEVTEIMMDLEVNSQNSTKRLYPRPRHSMPKLATVQQEARAEARSLWAIVDAASGARLGPLLVFEVVWDLP